MRSDLPFSPFVWILLIFLVLLIRRLWRGGKITPTTPKPPRASREPKSFVGLTRKLACEAGAQGVEPHPQAPGVPPPRMILARGRRCQVDATGHFCPHPNCSYRGWGAGAISALTAIPIAAAGDRSFVSVAEAFSWRRMTRRFTANRSSPTTLSGSWEPAPKAAARVFEVDPNTAAARFPYTTKFSHTFRVRTASAQPE